ncbi:Uncharacterised protein [Bordetella pertussis]|nr:Uncharacterised protein [Bordetella pertussis]
MYGCTCLPPASSMRLPTSRPRRPSTELPPSSRTRRPLAARYAPPPARNTASSACGSRNQPSAWVKRRPASSEAPTPWVRYLPLTAYPSLPATLKSFSRRLARSVASR